MNEINLDAPVKISLVRPKEVNGTITNEEQDFPHLIDEKVSVLLGNLILEQKPELYNVALSLLNSGKFTPTNETELDSVKQLVASTNAYNGIVIDGYFKYEVLKKLV